MHGRARMSVRPAREDVAEMDPWLQAATIGLLGLLIGLGFVFYGVRLFLILLPIWGVLLRLPVRCGGRHRDLQ